MTGKVYKFICNVLKCIQNAFFVLFVFLCVFVGKKVGFRRIFTQKNVIRTQKFHRTWIRRLDTASKTPDLGKKNATTFFWTRRIWCQYLYFTHQTQKKPKQIRFCFLQRDFAVCYGSNVMSTRIIFLHLSMLYEYINKISERDWNSFTFIALDAPMDCSNKNLCVFWLVFYWSHSKFHS